MPRFFGEFVAVDASPDSMQCGVNEDGIADDERDVHGNSGGWGAPLFRGISH